MKVARLTDMHQGVCDHGFDCCPHSVIGNITTGSSNVFANDLSLARDGDQVTHNCPHCGTGYISANPSSVFINGKCIAKLGDSVIYPGGNGSIIQASENVNAD